MSNATDALLLSASGMIGQQGTASNSCGNKWIPSPGFANSKTLVGGSVSSAINSKLYVMNTATLNPATNAGDNKVLGNAVSGTDNYYLNGTSGTVLLTNASSLACASLLTTGMKRANGTDNEEQQIHDEMLRAILLAPVGETEFSKSNHWMNQRMVMEQLKHGYVSNDPVVNAFYASGQNEPYAVFIDVDELIAQERYLAAQRLNASVVASNQVERNHQVFNRIYLNYLQRPDRGLSDDDRQVITELANSCAFVAGQAVYQSRSLLDLFSDKHPRYEDNCVTEDAAPILAHTTGNSSIQSGKGSFVLYPNPNDGNAFLTYKLEKQQAAEVIVCDVNGREAFRKELTASEGTVAMSGKELTPGVYYYRVEVNKEILHAGKMIIIR